MSLATATTRPHRMMLACCGGLCHRTETTTMSEDVTNAEREAMLREVEDPCDPYSREADEALYEPLTARRWLPILDAAVRYQRDAEKMRVETLCDACIGEGVALSGPCGCKGTGKLAVMVTTLRETLYDATARAEQAERERDALREALESVKAALGDRLLAGGPLAEPYAHGVMREVNTALAATAKGGG